MTYSAREVVKDGPFTAARAWHHVLKALVALALYAGLRDGLELRPWLAGLLASPVFLLLVTVKEWSWPSDPNEHAYSRWLRLSDFATDLACTSPALALGLRAAGQFPLAVVILGLGGILYLTFRHNARP